MWGINSLSQRYQTNNKLSFDNVKNNTINNSSYNNNNITNEYNLLCQTPIKQFDNIPNNNNNCNITPFRFDFNHFFGNLWSSGKIPTNQLLQQQIILSPSMNKDNTNYFKKSIEKSYKLSPISQLKDSNSNNNSICNSNNNITFSNQNNKINELYEINNNNGTTDLSKRNLNELFNNAKNDKFLYDENKKKKHIINNNAYNNRINIKNKNYNLQISRQFIYSSPCACTLNINKPKKIFECSGGSTLATITTRTINKNKRFRKNNEQLIILKKFYDEHKHWSKNQIKEISLKCGLKENKVYKWLWDQRNKEIKATKFVVKKDNNE